MPDNNLNIALGISVGIILLIGLFILGRALALWYWKIDKAIELLTEIRDSVRAQQYRSPPITPQQPSAPISQSDVHLQERQRVAIPARTVCADCGAVNAPGAEQCQRCKRFLR